MSECNNKTLGNQIFKHIFWFIAGLASVVVGVMLLAIYGNAVNWKETTPLQAIFIALLPVLIPMIFSVFFWRKSKFFALGVIVWAIWLAKGILIK
ncbi:MAG: hypothetical protein HQL26_10975 [Candidatus Omnitrophica bacterium]|nr:hypothetical protein [Candidatus Omnitrophota bacterium]